MKIIESACLVLFCTIISVSAGVSSAQEKTIAQLQSELISPWLVTVAGEDRTRTLRITGAAQKPDGTLLLEATYGWTDTGQSAIVASASLSGQKITLQFVTQSSSEIVTTQTPNGTFEGTFALKNGATKAISIQKISEDELKLKVATARAVRATSIIVKPAADVPAACAAFGGQWTGSWSQGGIGQQWLWVAGVDANCMAKYAYHSHPRPPTAFKTVKIENGVLRFACSGGRGTCAFESHGDKLWANYAGMEGNNSAVLEKIQ